MSKSHNTPIPATIPRAAWDNLTAFFRAWKTARQEEDWDEAETSNLAFISYLSGVVDALELDYQIILASVQRAYDEEQEQKAKTRG